MILAIDIGNTNITLGAFSDNTLVFESRLQTNHDRMEDQYAIEINDIINLYNVSVNDFEGAIISSVVPPITGIIYKAIKKLCNTSPIIIGPGIKTGLNIKIDNPAQLGADMVAGAVAVIDKFSAPAIIFDLGTATTVTIIDENKNLIGGLIMPGVGVSLDALIKRTAQLPQISFDEPVTLAGKNTSDSMRSGMILGTAAMMDGIAQRIENQLGNCNIVVTGGLSKDIIKYCEKQMIYCSNLVLDGLMLIYNKNHKK